MSMPFRFSDHRHGIGINKAQGSGHMAQGYSNRIFLTLRLKPAGCEKYYLQPAALDLFFIPYIFNLSISYNFVCFISLSYIFVIYYPSLDHSAS